MDAVIYRYGFHIMVEPDVSSFFSVPFTYTRRVQQGMAFSYNKVRLYDSSMLHEGRRAVCLPAGLTTRATRILEHNGYKVSFVDRRPVLLPEPDLTKTESPDDAQIEMLAAIITSDHGIIESPAGSGKSWLIRQICRIWPDQNIIIIIPGKIGTDLLRQTYQELLTVLHAGEVGMVGGGRRDNKKRITVCMDRSIMHAELEKCRILLFDEVHCAAAPSVSESLTLVTNARRFGFSASPMGRSDQSDLATIALFGEVIYKASYKEIEASGRVVPVEVFWLNTDKILPRQLELFANPDKEYPVTMVDRHLIWRNDERNKMIAGAVQSLRKNMGDDLQILIVVKTVDHAINLGRYLTDFQLVYGTMKSSLKDRYESRGMLEKGKHPITAIEREAFKQAFRKGTLRRVIATQVWGTGVDFPSLEVLVRADGKSSPIDSTQIPGRVTRRADGKSVGIVVDCSDGFYKMLEDRARKRKSIYIGKGWKVKSWG